MNKKELIEKYKKYENGLYDIGAKVACQNFLKDLEQLDEPEKITTPQFVAEYIEQKKDDDYHLLGAMIEIRSHKNKEIDEWFEEDDNMELFARAWLDGYEVEKKKIYTVKVKAVLGQYLGRYYLNNEELIPQFIRTHFTEKEKLPTFTRKELEEAGFGWVFDCEGVEVEEVEE